MSLTNFCQFWPKKQNLRFRGPFLPYFNYYRVTLCDLVSSWPHPWYLTQTLICNTLTFGHFLLYNINFLGTYFDCVMAPWVIMYFCWANKWAFSNMSHTTLSLFFNHIMDSDKYVSTEHLNKMQVSVWPCEITKWIKESFKLTSLYMNITKYSLANFGHGRTI